MVSTLNDAPKGGPRELSGSSPLSLPHPAAPPRASPASSNTPCSGPSHQTHKTVIECPIWLCTQKRSYLFPGSRTAIWNFYSNLAVPPTDARAKSALRGTGRGGAAEALDARPSTPARGAERGQATGHERSGEESRKWCGKAVWRARRPTLAAGEEATFFREKGGGSCRG